MWLWWVASLLILIASIVFALYIYYGSYKPASVKKEHFFKRRNLVFFKNPVPFTQKQLISSLKLKLQSVENNSMLYFNELKKLQQRIQALEKNKFSGEAKSENGDENWEELYYDVHDAKEKIENELDLSNQKLQETESLLNELRKRERIWKEKQSALQNDVNEVQSLRNKIEDLTRQLEGAAERESELQQQLEAQKEFYKGYDLLQLQHTLMKSEADELKNRIKEINNRDVLLHQKINRLTEMESHIEISEYEKIDIKKTLEEIITENESLAAKLHDMQEKLNAEKYA